MSFDDFFHDSADQPTAKSATGSTATAKKAPASFERWSANPVNTSGLVGELQTNTGAHGYNTSIDVFVAHGFVCPDSDAFADIGSVDCRNGYADLIQDADGEVTGLIFKVPNADEVFEDVVPPDVELAGDFSLIGEISDDMFVAADYASGLVVHAVTGNSVAVSHSVQNQPAVCRALQTANPCARIIALMGVSRAADVSNTKAMMAPLVGNANIRFALPTGALTFHQLYIAHGELEVKRALASANAQPEGWEAVAVDPEFKHVIAWPSPVHPGSILAGLSAHVALHTALNFVSICTLVLWIAATHFAAKFHIAPILALLSLTKRCGKTSTLAAIAPLVRRPLVTSDITAAGLYHACSLDATVLGDEVDQYINRSGSPLVGLFNAGQNRAASKVRRLIGGKLKSFDVFGFKTLCAIGELPGTVGDRAIIVPLLRKHLDEKVKHYRPADNDTATMLRAQLETFGEAYASQVAAAEPMIPDLGNDRAADNWFSLHAVASCAGDRWLEAASEAALALTQGEDEVPTVMEELIRDLAEIQRGTDDGFITSAELVKELCKDPEKPWATFTNNRNIGYHDLATLMRRLKLQPEQKHRNGQNLKGYALGDLADVFERYAPA